jgi:hypothetical protein
LNHRLDIGCGENIRRFVRNYTGRIDIGGQIYIGCERRIYVGCVSDKLRDGLLDRYRWKSYITSLRVRYRLRMTFGRRACRFAIWIIHM